MTHNIWFALPSLTVALIQAWVFIRSDKRTLLKESKPLTLLFIGLLGICLIEFGTYTNIFTPSLFIMKFYYVACFIGLTGIFLQAIKVSGFSFIKLSHTSIATTFVCLFLSFLMLGTDLLVSGFEYISYSYTRKPGMYYWVVQLFLASSILLTILTLYCGTKNKNKTDARRSKLLLISISPLLGFAILLISLMQSGTQINASLIFPIFIAYFFIVVLHVEKDESLFSLLIKLPYSKERESLNHLTAEIQQFLIDTELSHSNKNKTSHLSLKLLMNSIENLIVDHAVDISHGSQIKAASLLGVSSSSICRKKNRRVSP